MHDSTGRRSRSMRSVRHDAESVEVSRREFLALSGKGSMAATTTLNPRFVTRQRHNRKEDNLYG